MRANKGVLLAATLLGLSACSMAPDYHPPEVAAAPAYREGGPWQTAGANVPPAGKWWQLFADPALDALEERIEAGSPSLAAAVARYDQSLAIVRRSRADLLPDVQLGANVERDRLSAARPLSQGRAVTYTNTQIGGSLNYELDLFGRIRNTVKANQANAQASASDVDGGIASGIDVSRAQSQLASAKAELDAVAADRARDEHALAVLLGENPSTFTVPAVDTLIGAPAIPAALPSTLLERRPDIAAAERRVAAANAQIGVTRAALFPAISLGGAAGFEATGGDLLHSDNTFWALGPLSAALSIFDGGARRANIRISRAQYDEAAANYRETVLTAFREVEDDLATGRHLIDQERNQSMAAAAAERTRDLAMTRYRDGAADFLEVTIAQTAALDAQRALLVIRAQQLAVATDTVRALGGLY